MGRSPLLVSMDLAIGMTAQCPLIVYRRKDGASLQRLHSEKDVVNFDVWTGGQGFSTHDDPEKMLLNCDATSLRQMLEWGMRMIRVKFPRINERLIHKEFGDRRILLSLLICLYNYHCSTVGHNQILAVFVKRPPAELGRPESTVNLQAGHFGCMKKKNVSEVAMLKNKYTTRMIDISAYAFIPGDILSLAPDSNSHFSSLITVAS